MHLKDSKTAINLLRAFAGESQARNRYDMAAGVAKKEGYELISRVFLYTAKQEEQHARIFYRHLQELNNSNITIDGGYPVNLYDTTLPHLRAAQHNEYEEWQDAYQNFGDIAKEEGFEKIARSFHMIAQVEKTHGDRFGEYADLLESGSLYKRVGETEWLCLNCGYVHTGVSAPEICPVCQHKQGYFTAAGGTIFLP